MSGMRTDIGIDGNRVIVKITSDDDDSEILIELSPKDATEIGRHYMLAAEAATTGTIDPDGLTPMERTAIEWRALYASIVSSQPLAECEARARKEIVG